MKTTHNNTIADCYSLDNQNFSITDPNIETLSDHPYNLPASRLVDRRVEYLDNEGYTSSKCKGVKS